MTFQVIVIKYRFHMLGSEMCDDLVDKPEVTVPL